MNKTLLKMSKSITLLIMIFCLFGCTVEPAIPTDSNNTGTETNTTTENSTNTATEIATSNYTKSVATTSSSSYNEDDLIENTEFSNTIYINFDDKTVTVDSGTAQSISATDISLLDGKLIINNTNGVTVSYSGENALKYSLSGTLAGTFTVTSSEKKYAVVLNGTTITATDGPALSLQSKKRTFIVIPENTTNVLTDSTERTTDTSKASLYSKAQLIFTPETSTGTAGTLTINASYKHGIWSSDYVRIVNGTINVNCSSRDCIRTVNAFIFDDGTLTIKGTGTITDDESKGIKVEGEESEDGAGLGYVVINGGEININTISKGITASFDIEEDGDTTSTTYDPNPTVIVNNGKITITTTGTPYEDKDSDGNEISLSPEGIEGKAGLTVNNGYIVINSTDDCINVSQSKPLIINDGYLYCKSSKNDAIDSNGEVIINGGVIVAIGTNTPECAFDCDNNNFTITGGTLVGIGTNNYSKPTTNKCTQNVIVASSSAITANKTFALCDSSDNSVAFAYTIPSSYEIMVFSSPKVKTSSTYNIINGVSVNATNVFNGLYLGDITISGGTTGSEATISSSVTTIGSTTTQGPQEGTPGGFPGRM